MVNIYKVEFKTVITVDNKGEIIEDVEDVDVDDEELHNEVVGGWFHLGAYSLGKAFLEASEWLDEHVGEDEYEITTIKEKEKMKIVNWPGEDDLCDCLGCRTDRAAEEDKLTFDCYCGNTITVVDGGWDSINCPQCNEVILRDRIIGKQGNYILLNLEKKPVVKKEPAKKKRKSKGDENISKGE